MLSLKFTVKTHKGAKAMPQVEFLEMLQKETKKLTTKIPEAIQEQLETYLKEFLLERIRLNTPILTGKLRESLDVKVTRKGLRVTAVISSDRDYALLMHEVERALGPVSRKQPSQPEGGVGAKFIERVIDYHIEDIRKILGEVPESVLVQKAYKSGRKRNIREIT